MEAANASAADQAMEMRASIARRLRDVRLKFGAGQMTMIEFSEALGIEAARYRRYERAEVEPPIWVVREVHKLTGATWEAILGGAPITDRAELHAARAVGRRLQVMAAALGFTFDVPALAATLEADVDAVHDWLAGRVVPPVWKMLPLCKRVGVTLDWLYAGNERGLSDVTRRTLSRMSKTIPLDSIRQVTAENVAA